MKNNVKSYFYLWFTFLVCFLVYRSLFIIYNWPSFNEATLSSIAWSYIYGLKLDLSFSGYMMITPTLILIFTPLLKLPWSTIFMKWYLRISLCLTATIQVVDLKIYSYWGEKFDVVHLFYLEDPSQMTNSMDIGDFFIPLLLIGVLSFISILLSNKITSYFSFNHKPHFNFTKPLLFIALGGLSIIPMRGGFSIFPWRLGVPINTGAVYFSHNLAVNHAAVNTMWNFLFSISEMDNLSTRFELLTDSKATSLFEEFNGKKTPIKTTPSLLNSDKPNVLLIIVESLTAKAINTLGGKKNVTPQFNRLSKEGILFSHFYASGHRSNRGIGAIFSSYPGLPYSPILLHQNKVEQLPHLMGTFKDLGYNTAFYYGGEIDFANFRAYFQQGKADDIVSKLDFPFATMTTKWGVHDHVVFDTLFNDLNKTKKPFFHSIFTLSSHEPFDIPVEKVFGDKNNSEDFMSSVHYTDACIGKFIDKAKQTNWWKNTLVIITADHGVRHIDQTSNYETRTFHIPMLWLGGAINKKDTIISSLSCQIDIAPTLLEQLNIDHSDYLYGRNILSPTYSPRAFYSYGDGLGLITDSSFQLYNYEHNRSLTEGPFNEDKNYGKATFQYLSNDFYDK